MTFAWWHVLASYRLKVILKLEPGGEMIWVFIDWRMGFVIPHQVFMIAHLVLLTLIALVFCLFHPGIWVFQEN